MPCVAKKDEIERPALKTKDGVKETDFVLSIRELADWIKISGINFLELEDGDFDVPFGIGTGGGQIFAATGGVMEAALRTAYEVVTGKKLTNVNITDVRGLDKVKVAELDFNGVKVKVAVVHGIHNASQFIERLQAGDPELADIKFVEVMACPGGCVVGGGTAQPKDAFDVDKRIDAIYKIDSSSELRKSHENPSIKSLYDTYLGKPNSHLAHSLLHTHYSSKP